MIKTSHTHTQSISFKRACEKYRRSSTKKWQSKIRQWSISRRPVMSAKLSTRRTVKPMSCRNPRNPLQKSHRSRQRDSSYVRARMRKKLPVTVARISTERQNRLRKFRILIIMYAHVHVKRFNFLHAESNVWIVWTAKGKKNK